MSPVGSTGIWATEAPAAVGHRYKFSVHGADGLTLLKADPMAKATEHPPATASVVTASAHHWTDATWMADRATTDPARRPMRIYEVHLASWRPGVPTAEVADQLADYVSELGFTHVELLPVMEHPFGGSWGYQVTGYYAPTARLGVPDDLRQLIDRLHRSGIGVILDWVPAHFPKDQWALGRFDGTALYEHLDPRLGEHPDWGTYVFNYGRNEVRNFLVANALYWFDEFHIDGLRVDAVASMLYRDYSRGTDWLPNRDGGRENTEAIEFLQELNTVVFDEHPDVVMVAEESTAWPKVSHPVHDGGLGFSHKWNMGWMHDTLQYMSRDPVHRQWHHGEMTFGLVYAFNENFVLPLSHDEVVHGKGSMLGKMPGDDWQRYANLRAYYGFMWGHPGKKLLFMGAELAQAREWSHERSLDWHLLDDPRHAGVQRLVRDLNRVQREHPALFRRDFTPDGFSWIDHQDAARSMLSFVRHGDDADAPVLVVSHFTPAVHHAVRLGVPRAGTWREVLNTDSAHYGGSNVGQIYGAVVTEPVPAHGHAQSIVLTVPPLATLFLAWTP